MAEKIAVRAVADGVWELNEDGFVRALVVEGSDSALLVDTCMTPTDFSAQVRALTDRPLQVILTHAHCDHCGNIGAFPEVMLHPAELAVLHENCPERRDGLRFVEEGHRLDLGGRVLRVLHTPGHTPGSICLLDETNGVLYAGDTVSHAPIWMFGPHRDLKQYLESLERLRGMMQNGLFDTIYPCHAECPVDLSALDELIELTRRIFAGTAAHQPSEHTGANGAPVPLYTWGSCGMFYL